MPAESPPSPGRGGAGLRGPAGAGAGAGPGARGFPAHSKSHCVATVASGLETATAKPLRNTVSKTVTSRQQPGAARRGLHFSFRRGPSGARKAARAAAPLASCGGLAGTRDPQPGSLVATHLVPAQATPRPEAAPVVESRPPSPFRESARAPPAPGRAPSSPQRLQCTVRSRRPSVRPPSVPVARAPERPSRGGVPGPRPFPPRPRARPARCAPRKMAAFARAPRPSRPATPDRAGALAPRPRLSRTSPSASRPRALGEELGGVRSTPERRCELRVFHFELGEIKKV